MPKSVPCRHLLLQNKKTNGQSTPTFPYTDPEHPHHTPNTDNLYPFISLPSVGKTAG